MKPQIWLATFGVVALLLIGGAGFFCLKAKGGYDDAVRSWDGKLNEIKKLSARKPYPNKKAQDALKKNLVTYKKAVSDLYANLNRFQKPLNKELKDTEFQQLVRKKVDALKALSKENDFKISEEEEFYLGFDIYKGKIPAPEMVPILEFELGAIDHLFRTVVGSGADSLSELTRDLAPGEEGAVLEKHEESLVHKYPVRMRFYGDHSSFQNFLNRVANDKEYFYIVRVMKVDNEKPESPAKLTALEGDELPRYKNPLTQEVATSAQLAEIGKWPDASEADLQANMKAAGFEPASEDARVLMGDEKLNIFLVVDIVRFLDPDTEEVKAAKKPRNAKASPRPR